MHRLNRRGGLALFAVILLSLNMRAAIPTISPIAAEISHDIPLSTPGLAVLGALPPLAFGVFGLLTPVLARRVGMEFAALLAIVAIVVGHLGRALAPGYPILFVSSAVALGGIGIVNVLLPPFVKRYFPRRIPLMLSITAAMTSVGTAVPALIVYPVSEDYGWRVALGMWAVFAVVAVPPWIRLSMETRRIGVAAREASDDPDLEEPNPTIVGRVNRAPIAWALLVAFAVAMINLYAIFAWLPQVLIDIAGSTPEEAGALLALYSSLGFCVSLILGFVAPRVKRLARLIHIGVAAFVIGYVGLLLVPTTLTWLWIMFAGIGPTLMHICYMLVGIRTRSHAASVALSAFMQGFGYALGALGPLLFGLLHGVSGGWVLPLGCFVGISLLASMAALLLRSDRMLEDQWLSKRSSLRGGGGISQADRIRSSSVDPGPPRDQ